MQNPIITSEEELQNWVNSKDCLIQIAIGVNFKDGNENIECIVTSNLNEKLNDAILCYYAGKYTQNLLDLLIEDAKENIFLNSDISLEEIKEYIKASTKVEIEKLKTKLNINKR